MMLWTMAIFTTVIFFIVLWHSRVSVEFDLAGGGQPSMEMTVTLRMWRIFSHTKSFSGSGSALDEEGIRYTEKDINSRHKEKTKKKKTTYTRLASRFHHMYSEYQHVKRLGAILGSFLQNVRVSSFKWETVIGTGDASSTAKMAGVLWSVKGMFINLLHTFLSVKKEPIIEVHPLFSHAFTKTHVSGMFSFKIGHAIVVMLRLMRARRQSRIKPNRSSNAMTGGIET
ncbi:DUF2953 domain-containing protein [Fictibacillus iocasae]|uniref:DUF2953 domain-containing protein n=1 Tax=Fictibacillus iocasae TaxID=2715437 RepID=A0ABW2NSE0_9BACL